MAHTLPLIVSVAIAISVVFNACWALPVETSNVNLTAKTENSSKSTSDEIFFDSPVDVSNITVVPKDLIVIRTFIYEVGILTAADPNDTDDSTQSFDEINIRSFQPPKNTSVNWWKTFDSNATDATRSPIAFERILPVGMSIIAGPNEQGGEKLRDATSTDESSEESEEEFSLELL